MISRIPRMWRQRRVYGVGLLVLGGGAAVLGAARHAARLPPVPTADVTRGEFIDSLQFRGEMKALKSVTIAAPGQVGELQILTLAHDGTPVKPGDTVVEFDKTKTVQELSQFRSTLRSAEAEIEQARAQAHLAEEEDTTALLKTRYDVEAAKLDASKREIVSQIDGAEAELKVSDAQQKLREAEEKLKSDRAKNQATIGGKIRASEKAVYDVENAQRALSRMTLLAPSSGVISLLPNWRNDDNAPFKPGDRAWPGAALAELPDASTLRVSARVDETERGRLALMQSVHARLDAIPDRQFTGKLAEIGTIASADFSGGWPILKNFDLAITLDQQDSRLRPGMTAQVTVIVDRVPNALTIPVQASFQESGRTVTYVWSGSKFEQRVIEVGRRSGDRALVAKGLHPGDRVALKDPSIKE